ncbi:bifunctional 3-(3-hydroxy-phenyl)propionate/3-hydroxycinnamic acid hydroxylase MhpA [Actinomadura opuntiae]|uniref:bifunctional 3-(3-hydroxy-phenyl)propionate/3-hydroxycinnamic acid hydroxylase MhpA n=1 Tax=Actinomadura sp. OS1-43 TaxID=604315 RepID=UPI00255ACC1A|nr:bifunctional 3-(3-hydroxy-phenyl)propionate/3-hydroxycinnamic acid hydroxylase [Actinomadura sp. OS1-43]MDL4813273.1 bifunctional 3-(3-hydroxy-phenyl)propionate/3-hydroxycinnamic acid hydroxylase [Actinomadura sp. OS1-43]
MTDDFDIVQIGCGPVGQTFAALLGQAGHRIGVFERWPDRYPLPRAGHFDHEVMRVFQSIGIADEVEKRAIALPDYDWINGDGRLLMRLDWNVPTPSGWKSDYMFYQPHVEDELSRAVQRHENVSVHMGWEAVELVQHTDHVEITLREGRRASDGWRPTGRTRTVRGGHVVGADGAGSFVRRASNIDWVDFGFSEDWMVLDVRPHDPDMDIDMPEAAQICDPARPVTLFRWLGREHSRWEFMLLPGESAEQMVAPDVTWDLLSRWGLHPGNADIVRNTVYTFRSLLAESFQRDRVFLIGDAAHLMPPFMGQGMCSGIRDAANLAWKLDTVLERITGPSLLETYNSERRPHARELILASMDLGRIVCVADTEAAAQRDQAFLSGQAPPPPTFPILTGGLLHRSAADAVEAPAGQLSVQGRVLYDGRVGRMDDLLGNAWTLLSRKAEPESALNGEQRRLLEVLGTRSVHVTRATMPADSAAVDLDATYTRWFATLDADVVLVRPDHHVFGAAKADRLGDLVDDLRRQLPILLDTDAA